MSAMLPPEELDAAVAAARDLVEQSAAAEEQVTFYASRRDADLMAEAPRLIPSLLAKVDALELDAGVAAATIEQLRARVAELEAQLAASKPSGAK